MYIYGASSCALLPAPLSGKLHDCVKDATAAAEDAHQEREAARQDRDDERKAALEQRAAERETLRAQRESQYEHSLQAKMSMDFSQQFQLGELQVDTAKLEQLMAQRKVENDELDKIYAEQEKQRMAMMATQARAQAAYQGQAMAAACNCAIPAPSCNQPAYQGPQPKPAQRALRPTDIPFVVPVTLRVGMQNARLTSAAARKSPTQLPAKRACAPGSCAPDACAPACTTGVGRQIDTFGLGMAPRENTEPSSLPPAIGELDESGEPQPLR
jgi:hypothetical protein